MRAISVFLVIAGLLLGSAAGTASRPPAPPSTTLIFGADVAPECSVKCVLEVEAAAPDGSDTALAVEQAPLRPWNTLTLLSDDATAYKARLSCPDGCWTAAGTAPVPLWPPPAAASDANASTNPHLTYTLLSDGINTSEKLPQVYRIELQVDATEEKLLTVHRAARPLCDSFCAHRAALKAGAVAWVVLCPALGWLVGGLWMQRHRVRERSL